jgi:hypothetical protein
MAVCCGASKGGHGSRDPGSAAWRSPGPARVETAANAWRARMSGDEDGLAGQPSGDGIVVDGG